MSASNDGSESVDQFLARIASLKEGRDDDNVARTRQMEDEILKGRQERQARRLERARSISPSKTGPAKVFSTSTSSKSTTDLVINPPVEFNPPHQRQSHSPTQSLSRSNATIGRSSPTRDLDTVPPRPLPSPGLTSEPARPLSTATGLARSGTLSWQQRPASRDGSSPRQRPLSGFAPVRALPRPPTQDEPDQEPTRQDIAASLAQKDPTWFRQTQDRGSGSAAFRKSQVEEISEPLPSASMRLPGMSQIREPSKSPAPESRHDNDFSHSTVDPDRFRRGHTPDIAALRASMTMDKPSKNIQQQPAEIRPLSSENEFGDTSTPSLTRTSSILSSNRPVSPTKGLGGFVESAMMRRSDSVSKRWSVKANTGLKRGDSVAAGRPTSMHTRGLSRDLHSGRDPTPSSPIASSRPTSSHGRDDSASAPARQKSASVEPTEVAVTKDENPQKIPSLDVDDSLLAHSPSKTMDPRRWSPTKATWLESALQAESPKLAPFQEEQPKWKVDLQRSRSRASRDVSPEKRFSKQDAAQVPTEQALPPSKTFPSDAVEQESPVSTVQAKIPAAEVPVHKDLKPIVKPKPRSVSSNQDESREIQVSGAQLSEEPTKIEIKQQTIDTTKKLVPELKPKPQTPPKTDFRSTLKSRGTGPTQNAAAEPEFKSVFGKLKRATTQNYVAPDELKTNILTGKAALNATAGPQKTKHVDEFKESILAKKEVMKAANSKPQRSDSPSKDEVPIPEALARRKTLSKASVPNLNVMKTATRSVGPTPAPKPAVALKSPELGTPQIRRTESDIPSDAAKKPNLAEHGTQYSPNQASIDKESLPPVTGTPQPAVKPLQTQSKELSSTQAMTPRPLDFKSHGIPSWKPISTTTETPVQVSKSTEASTKVELPVGSKLASRLNPNLAAILSRGSSPRPHVSRDASDDAIAATESTTTATVRREEQDSGSLTHMTKGRAKGPKRRAPKADIPSVQNDAPKSATQSATVKHANTVKKAPEKSLELDSATPAKESPEKPSVVPRELPQSKSAMPNQTIKKLSTDEKETEPKIQGIKPETAKSTPEETKMEATKPKPVIAVKSPELRKVSSSAGINEQLDTSSRSSAAAKPLLTSAAKSTLADKMSNIGSPQSLSPARPVKSNLVVSKSRDPEIISSAKGSDPAPAQGVGLKTNTAPVVQKPVVKPRTFTPPVTKQQPKASILPQEIKAIVESYVGPVLKEYEKADFDSQQFLLDAKNDDQRIKTLNYTIHEISGDGKKTPMPPQQDHILYEESMYLITHTFSISNGANTSEVHLWRGDRVADAAVEDAQIFCKRDAREHNTKLEVVKQGKEPTRLLQALGGILIVRRSKNVALYMLCGRRHLGHIVFDEVEMISSNLCPGYTYLISAQYGKLYLWKGKGAGADEIGSARLIGMDLGLTGEIEEVDQGSESPSFWDIFGTQRLPTEPWSSDWSRRTELNGYPTVLYRIEHERPGLLGNLWGLKRAASPSKAQPPKATVERLASFAQSDLESPTIHIIDAYRTIYVVVTRQCTAKAAEFVTALHLAQDFAMLSPATQDRPILPNCFVIVGDLTCDAKAAFRKWSVLEGTMALGSGRENLCVKLEEVMDALGL